MDKINILDDLITFLEWLHSVDCEEGMFDSLRIRHSLDEVIRETIEYIIKHKEGLNG